MNGYNLDTKAAKEANAGGRIDSTGKYVGLIKKAEFITSKKGTDGVEFEFLSSTGESATLQLWTRNANNPQLSGFKMLMAVMTCAGVKNMTPTKRRIKKYDYDMKEMREVEATIAPEFDGKAVGLLLQREEYEKNDGGIGYRMNIFAAAQHSTDLTANEILERKTQPEELFKLMERLADKKAKPKAGGVSQPAAANAQAGVVNLDDDLPW